MPHATTLPNLRVWTLITLQLAVQVASMAPRLPAPLLAAAAAALLLLGPTAVHGSSCWGSGSASNPAPSPPSPSGQPAAALAPGGADCSSLAAAITGVCAAELVCLQCC